jgi:tetratricopeptide (TPR) repeat protein
MAKPRKRARAPQLPLAWRLPNPPAVFVGRGPDVAWLTAAIERAPLSLVTGPGGLGKTALVLQTLHASFAKQVPRTVHVDVPAGQPAAQVRHEVLRALAQARGDGEVDWAELQAEPEVAVAVALDMAEAGGYWIVIDDVYQGDADETNDMLVQLASFARKSRWIATSRHTPRLAPLAGQVLTLEAMAEAELLELARAWAPNADPVTVRQALVASSGSPWLLHQLLVTGATARSLGEGGLLQGLADDAVALLRALALVEVPLPLGVLALFAPEPSPSTLDALERRGLVHHAPNGYRLHDVARGMLLGPTREAMRSAEAAHAAAVLSQQDAPDAQLEGARLLVALDRVEALAALLDRCAERLVAEGYAPRLFQVVREVDDPRVVAWQLRCAAELGNPTALGQVHAPAGREPDEVLAWARTLLAQGDVDEAITRARQVLSGAEAGTPLYDEASFLLASCLRHASRHAESAAALEAIAGRDEQTSLRRDAGLALSGVLAGSAEHEVDLRGLRRRAGALEPHIETACEIAEALLCVGRPSDAAEVLDRARSSPRGARPALLASRQASLLAARIHLRAGELDAARRLADEVRAFARGSSVLLPVLHTVDATRRLVAG